MKRWFRNHIVNLFIIGSMALFLFFNHYKHEIESGTDGYNLYSIVFLTFGVGLVILSGIGLRVCIDRFENWYERVNATMRE